MSLFGVDSLFNRFMNKLINIVAVNVLFVICSLPVFTIGASATAMYTLLFRMAKNEEGYIARSFFKAFKSNFRQATAIWLIMLAVGAVFVLDILITNQLSGTYTNVLKVVFLVLMILYVCVLSYVFPVLSRFDNTTKNTLINSFWMAVSHLPLTISVLVIEILPVFIMYMIAKSVLYLVPVMVIIGFAGLAFLCVPVFSKIFAKFTEDKPEDAS